MPESALAAFQPRGQLTIAHTPAAVTASSLRPVFGDNDAAVLRGSWVEAAGLQGGVCFARNTGPYRLYALAVTPTRLDVIVEPGSDTLMDACEDCWQQLRMSFRRYRPTCQSAEIYEGSGRRSHVGSVLMRAQTRGRLWPIMIGGASGAMGVVAGVVTHNLWGPIIAAFPSVANAIYTCSAVVKGRRTQRIQWTR